MIDQCTGCQVIIDESDYYDLLVKFASHVIDGNAQSKVYGVRSSHWAN